VFNIRWRIDEYRLNQALDTQYLLPIPVKLSSNILRRYCHSIGNPLLSMRDDIQRSIKPMMIKDSRDG
jgi:hypothetical protein